MALTPERIRELWENYSPTQGIESFARAVEAAALESQSREIAALKEQEAQLCTLYGLAEAECKRLRKDAERLDFMCGTGKLRMIERDSGVWRVYQDEAALEAEHHRWQCMTLNWHPSARTAIDAAIAAKGGSDG